MRVVINSIFQKPSAGQIRPTGGLFKRPAEAPKDGFVASEPMEAFKAPVISKTAEVAVPKTTGAAAATASALPGPLAALYNSILSVVSDSPQGSQQLQTLADQGKLSEPTLQNLSDLTQKPRASGLDGAALTRETVAILSGPDQNIWQSDRFTCGATNLERQLAENPEAFTQLVANLSSLEGKTFLTSGFELARAEGSANDDGSGRTSADRLIQSSIMATAGAARGAYDVTSDRFGEDREGGLKIAEISAITALAQNQAQVVIAYGTPAAKATAELLTRLQPGESFQTAMTNWESTNGRSNGKDHMLLVQGCQNGEVTYFDPADHAQHTVSQRDFLWKTQYLVLPQSLADRVQFSPESIHSKAEI